MVACINQLNAGLVLHQFFLILKFRHSQFFAVETISPFSMAFDTPPQILDTLPVRLRGSRRTGSAERIIDSARPSCQMGKLGNPCPTLKWDRYAGKR
jgi:hypothetical protein